MEQGGGEAAGVGGTITAGRDSRRPRIAQAKHKGRGRVDAGAYLKGSERTREGGLKRGVGGEPIIVCGAALTRDTEGGVSNKRRSRIANGVGPLHPIMEILGSIFTADDWHFETRLAAEAQLWVCDCDVGPTSDARPAGAREA